MSWDHGYYTDSIYTSGYYREMAPNWLDFVALTKAHNPPRSYEGAPFRYLELGCGMGFGLCLMASLYPEGDFVGVDFLPDHVAHGHWLAASLGLVNIRFLEADFLELKTNLAPLASSKGLGEHFHYVAAHGIATWVVEPVQEALLSVAARCLEPGGILYCSYNTLPGWLQRSAFQQLVQMERERCDPSEPSLPVQKATASIRALWGTSESPTPMASRMPQLAADLDAILTHNQLYVNQEYANDGWQPLYIAEMVRRCRRHKLSLLGSATLPELFPQLLPEPARSLVLAEGNPLMRETLIDLATMQSFRRDLYVKGHNTLTRLRRDQRLAEVGVCKIHQEASSDFNFECSFGTLTGSADVHGAAEAALDNGPLSFSDWSHTLGQSVDQLLLTAALLLHKNRIGLDRGFAANRATEQCISVNLRLIDLFVSGSPFHTLAAPRIGTGTAFTAMEALMMQGHLQGLANEDLSRMIQASLEEMGAVLRDSKQKPITKPAKQLSTLREAQKRFFDLALPSLEILGVFPSDLIDRG